MKHELATEGSGGGPGEPGVTRTTCPYCGVGCGVLARTLADGSVAISGDPEHPANFGRLCAKGAALGETLALHDRLLAPQIAGREATWDDALALTARQFSDTVAEYGPDSVAFYVSGQLLTEDYYVANKLMKGFIGSANIDTNSRLCMASSVAGHKRAFGTDTVPGTYEDLELADLVVLVGSNLAWCHPVLHQRLMAAKEARPGLTIITIDPRETATTDASDLHLKIRPGSDVALFNGLLAFLADHQGIDNAFVAAHTEGIGKALLASWALTISETLDATGLSYAAFEEFCARFAATEKVVTVFSQGVNQSATGTDKVNAIINVHLATGRIGRPGMGPFSVTGQPNAMGGREVGGMANQLAAHGELDNREDRKRVAAFWGVDKVASRPGLKAVELFRAVASGKIKALLIAGTNPVASMPDADAVRTALAACPFVAVIDVMAATDTTALADVLLPATGWGEKSGTVTNSERRISRQRAFLPSPGKARADWAIFAELGRRMGFSGFDYQSAAEIFREHAGLSGKLNAGRRDFDISGLKGLSDAAYDRLTPVQWPVPASGTAGGRFFGAGGAYRPGGRLSFVATSAKPATGGEFVLNTGRVRDQWHTMTRTGQSPRLSGHIGEGFVEINDGDAARLGIDPAGLVELTSAQGRAVLRARPTSRQQAGSLFAPIHWTDQQSAVSKIARLVEGVVDPVSGQPGLKESRVTAKAFPVAVYGYAVMADKPAVQGFDYATRAVTRGGWRLEFACKDEVTRPEALAESFFGPHATLTSVSDAAAGRHAIVATKDGRVVGGLWLAAQPVAVSRVFAANHLGEPESEVARLIAGRAGAAVEDGGALVCSCFNIGIKTIEAAFVSGACRSLAEIGATLKAGSNCGSCRPEIRRVMESCLNEKA